MHKQKVDVAIVGAGIVGCLLANLLAKKLPHFNIALIDKQAPTVFDVNHDIGLRVYAINHASQYLFEELGLWSQLQQQRVCPYQQMTVWHEQDQSLSFDATEIGQTDLGHIIEHDLLHHVLYQSVQQNEAIQVLCPATVKDLHIESHIARITLDTDTELDAKLVVAADGANSAIRTLCNISVDINSYLQSAIVAVVETEKSHQHTAWQRFLHTGPLAFLPLDDGRSSIVWSLPEQQASILMNTTEAAFASELAEQSQYQLGQVKTVGKRAVFALQQLQAQDYVKPRVALVGDAAHVVHPLAGQGLNLGLNDASVLVDTVYQANKQGVDIGQYHILKRYARRSQLHNRIMAEAFGGLNQLFASHNILLQNVRGYGLSYMEKAKPLKRFFIQQAIGRI